MSASTCNVPQTVTTVVHFGHLKSNKIARGSIKTMISADLYHGLVIEI